MSSIRNLRRKNRRIELASSRSRKCADLSNTTNLNLFRTMVSLLFPVLSLTTKHSTKTTYIMRVRSARM